MMRFSRLAPAVLMVTLAPAAGLAAPGGQDRPCRDDIVEHCADAMGDRQAMASCIRDNVESFSRQCRDALRARMQDGRMAGGAPEPRADAEP